MKNSKKLFDKRYKEIMEELGTTVHRLLVAEGLDIKPRVVSHKTNSSHLDEMARAAVKRTIDKKAYANAADVIRRHNYDVNWAKTVSPNPKLDDYQLLHRYVSALMCLKQPCPQTEADIDKIGVFADYAHTLLDADHTGTLNDIITLYNEQDPIESRGSRTGTARAAKGWRKNNTNTQTTTSDIPAYDDVLTDDETDATDIEEPVETPVVSKETEEVPASDFSFDSDDDEEETTPEVVEPEDTEDDEVETADSDDEDDTFDFGDEETEDESDDEDDTDDALDNDSEDENDDESGDSDDEEDFFGDDDEDETPAPTRSRRSTPKDDEEFDFEDNDDSDDDALDNDSEDEEDDDDDLFGDTDDDFFSDDENPDDDKKSGRDDTVWGNEAQAEEDEEDEEDDDPSKITDIKAVTYEQYMDPEMNNSFHDFSPNKILINDEGKIGFEFGVQTDMDENALSCFIYRDTFGDALKTYIILNQAAIDSYDDFMFQFVDTPVIKQFKKRFSSILSNDTDMDSEIEDKSEEVSEKCFYKAKTAQDVVDYINNKLDF